MLRANWDVTVTIFIGIWTWLQAPSYLSRVDHYRKIRAKKQRTDIGKYSFLNRTITELNKLPTEALGTSPCKPHIFRKRVRKVINSEVKLLKVLCKSHK